MSQTEKLQKYQELIHQCDQWIKAGDLSSVAHAISSLNFAQVPRSSRQNLAKICRRAGLISQGLKLLQPIVRQEKQKLEPASAGEVCEYSVLLSRNGSIDEAQTLLEKIDPSATPEAFLYRAFCHISKWEYAKAAPLLEKFLTSSADDYSKLIGRVNLASAYLSTDQLQSAEKMLHETIELAERAGAARLAGNCLELLGHVHFQNNDYSQARKILDQGLKAFANNQSYDPLMIHKTQAIMEGLEKKSMAPLLNFRKEALEKKYWEMVREMDVYLGKIQFEQMRFDHLIFGSPLAAFRHWASKELGGAEASATYILGSQSHCLLDLTSGRLDQGDLAAGKKIHQTIAALVQDFYKPKSMGSLFSTLYPNEYFDINSSHHRVEQLLWRTRKWLSENEIPASIEQVDGAYQFRMQNSFGIQMSLQSSNIDQLSAKWQQLQNLFPPGTSFSAPEACEKLNWPRTNFLRVVQWASQEGKLQRSGSARATVYKISGANNAVKKSA